MTARTGTAWIETSAGGKTSRTYGSLENVSELLTTHIVVNGRHLPTAKARYARALVTAAVRRAREISDDRTAAVTCAGVRARIGL